MAACASCGAELPSGATFCPSCGASSGVGGGGGGGESAPASVAVAGGGEAGGLLLVGTIGAYTTVLVTLLAIIRNFAGMRSQALLIMMAILGLGGLVGIGVGMLGHRRATGLGLATGAAVMMFVAAFLALTPLIAFAARSRSMMYVIIYVLPIISMLAWALAGAVGLSSKDHFGSGLAGTVGWTFLISAAWELIAMLVLLGGGIRSRGSMKMIAIVSILFMIARAGGLVALALGFTKLRSGPTS